ncbi:uncharacterized protein LOC111026132 [Momordica charantia]|uniref:Ninja-family protein n=1 Tax=Momordica charantia TaxID=3673 RepID=A0A6J1DZY7_MOMCH|nr:uncharacterized protein LOC111026132 [Momordica charantia]
MRHHDGDMELDLGLSIGGSLRRLPETTTSGSSLTLISDGDEESGVTDAKARGEIQAVRRREAKRKREEKRHRRAQQQQPQNPPFKKGKQEAAALGSHSQCNVDHPPLQMPYTYYVPFLNGYAFPCVVPYWSAAAAGADHHPVPCRSFGPFQTNQNVADAALSNGCQSWSKSTKSASGSSGSSVCSSSVISDHYHSSSSHEGGDSSSYTRRNSSNSSSDGHQMTQPNPNDPKNDSPSSDLVKPDPCVDNRTQCPEKSVQSHVSKSGVRTTIKKEPIASNKDDEVVEPSTKPVSSSLKSSPPMSLKNRNMENGKPPKPQIQTRNIPSLQQMPCVSTTGVGPNGKTITGFLYKYSNLEVSILCVCHGESFAPAEFVKHAGGAEVSHPLRHITVLPTNVIPSAIR